MENGKWKMKLIELIIENFSNNQLFSVFHFPFSIHYKFTFSETLFILTKYIG